VVWAQEPQASYSPTNPAEVFQAAVMHWPFPTDCNGNGIADTEDLDSGTSQDCNGNSKPDECDINGGTSDDENDNGVPDECEIVLGDLNCDGVVNFGDINPFVLLLSNWLEWQNTYPGCLMANGDLNEDGVTGFADINPFVALLSQP